MQKENVDLEAIAELLRYHHLPYEDIVTSDVEFITVEENGQLQGCIGLETYDKDGLLRSFAVNSNFQGHGIGYRLLEQLVDHCKFSGVSHLHLLTTTAVEYFREHGFHVADRSLAPPAITRTTEFDSICPASAIYMVRELNN